MAFANDSNNNLHIESPIDFLKTCVDNIRPPKSRDVHQATENIVKLTQQVQQNQLLRLRIANAISDIISKSQVGHLFEESGILTSSGFFAELNEKLVYKFLPTLLPDKDLRIYLAKIFTKPWDFRWVWLVDLSIWTELFKALQLNVIFNEEELLKAGETLSYRIAALGLDKRITQKAHRVVNVVNAFVEQNKLVTEYIANMRNRPYHTERKEGYKNIMTAIDIGLRQVHLIRDYKRTTGTSLQQTFVVERIDQQLHRLKILLNIIDPDVEVKTEEYVQFFKATVKSEQTKNKLTSFFSANFSYLAYNIAEHGGRTGEKYIANNKGEFSSIFKAAVKGGLIISLAALIKITISNQHFAPFWNSFLIGINYAIAFVIIHLIGGTIATKQPALTASTIASALDQPGHKMQCCKHFR